jgi:hypothetical protein
MKSVKWANRFAAADTILMISTSVVIIGVWAISAGLFHKQPTPGFNVPNIWSWACNHKAESDDTVDFNRICITQVYQDSILLISELVIHLCCDRSRLGNFNDRVFRPHLCADEVKKEFT